MKTLEASIGALRSLSEQELFDSLQRALDRFEDRYLPVCARSLAITTGMSEAMVLFGLKRTVRGHQDPALKNWLSTAKALSHKDMPDKSKVLLQVLPGNVPGLAIPATLESLLARCPVLLKASREDRVVPEYWVRALEETSPVLAGAVAWEYWKGGDDPREPERFQEADLIIASGNQRTMDAILRESSTPVIQHGPKFSLAVVGEGWASAPESWWEDVARECVIWEQRGCLSPVFFFVLGSLPLFAEKLCRGMSVWDATWPSAEDLDSVMHGRKLRTHVEFLPQGEGQWFGQGSTVAWTRELLPFVPQGRSICVHPLELLAPALEQFAGQIQGIGVAYQAPVPSGESGIEFPLTQIQDPPAGWRADGRSVLVELLR